jgi:Rha family phage regulatory protein
MIFRCKNCGKFLFEASSPEKITSVEVAKMFNKRHAHVMEDIRRLCYPRAAAEKNILDGPNFRLITYKDTRGREKPCYEMSRQGFRMLTARYRATQLRAASHPKSEECVEIKNGSGMTKIYGIDRIELICKRCGTVNVF